MQTSDYHYEAWYTAFLEKDTIQRFSSFNTKTLGVGWEAYNTYFV